MCVRKGLDRKRLQRPVCPLPIALLRPASTMEVAPIGPTAVFFLHMCGHYRIARYATLAHATPRHAQASRASPAHWDLVGRWLPPLPATIREVISSSSLLVRQTSAILVVIKLIHHTNRADPPY